MKTLLLLLSLNMLYAQTPAPSKDIPITETTRGPSRDHAKMKEKKGISKTPKASGEISTSGCVLANGKTLSEGDFGYDDCVRQVGLKKTN